MSADQFALEIRWDDAAIHLPEIVGPFADYAEADHWGRLNCPNGVYTVRILAQPYAGSTTKEAEKG